MHKKSSSIWSCENLYVNRYLKGLVDKDSICVAIEIVDLMQVTNPIVNVLRCDVESSCGVGVVVFNESRYCAEDDRISCHVSLLESRKGDL